MDAFQAGMGTFFWLSIPGMFCCSSSKGAEGLKEKAAGRAITNRQAYLLVTSFLAIGKAVPDRNGRNLFQRAILAPPTAKTSHIPLLGIAKTCNHHNESHPSHTFRPCHQTTSMPPMAPLTFDSYSPTRIHLIQPSNANNSSDQQQTNLKAMETRISRLIARRESLLARLATLNERFCLLRHAFLPDLRSHGISAPDQFILPPPVYIEKATPANILACEEEMERWEANFARMRMEILANERIIERTH
ncbi:hypothetical protein BJ508DRAFT_333814 [Ascobolus immersus RN42]|uniref:Uncharacterized protein n=1 Tax=Ascobolus immersus RN42 TaxID=1160509 RepID=A0A3N4HPD8_ASCIM|nr:hypothetical protein BJ508DRAFT_333814 [Ascobolus immersus RN42]